MTNAPPAIPRANWDAVSREFARFFAGMGGVRIDEHVAEFTAPDTGLNLERDGTSHSFMPLHELGARWEEVAFDHDAGVVELRNGDMSYRYRVPPRLRVRQVEGP